MRGKGGGARNEERLPPCRCSLAGGLIQNASMPVLRASVDLPPEAVLVLGTRTWTLFESQSPTRAGSKDKSRRQIPICLLGSIVLHLSITAAIISPELVSNAAIRTLFAYGTRRQVKGKEIVNIASRSGHGTCTPRSAPQEVSCGLMHDVPLWRCSAKDPGGWDRPARKECGRIILTCGHLFVIKEEPSRCS